MATTHDHILQGTAQAEEILRDHGAWGRSFPELIENLATRENLPRRVRSKALRAHRMCERAVRDPAPIHDFELHEWTQGINALLDWVRSRDERSADPGADQQRADESRPRANIVSRWLQQRPARPWKFEAWMVVAGFVVVFALGGVAVRAVTTRKAPVSMTAEQALDGIQSGQAAPRNSHPSALKLKEGGRDRGDGSH
jgi:hypothetical protein